MKRRRWLFAVALALALASFPAIDSIAGQQEAQSCGNDSVLVWPVSRTGPLPESEVVAVGINGEERARFPIERPLDADFADVPGRAIVLDQIGGASIIDVADASIFPVDTGANSEPLEFVDETWVSFPGETSLTAMSPGFGDVIIADLETRETEVLFGSDIFELEYATNGELVVANSFEGLLVWPAGSSELRVQLALSAPFDLSPDGAKLIYLDSDYSDQSSALMLLNLDGGETSTLVSMPTLNIGFEVLFLEDSSVAFAVEQLIVVHNLDSNESTTHQLNTFNNSVHAVRGDGSALLYRGFDEPESDAPGSDRQQWYWLDLSTGASSSINELSGFEGFRRSENSSWMMFGRGFEEEPEYIALDLDSGQATTLQPVGAASESATLLGLAPDGRSALIEVQTDLAREIRTFDFLTGQNTLVAAVEGTATVKYSPDGCFFAIGDYHPTPELRSATVNVYSTSGELATTIDDAVLVGWAPAT